MDKDIGKILDVHNSYNQQYTTGRPLNNDLISSNFHNSQNAYSAHMIIDHTGKSKYIAGDNTVSIIDLKTAKIFRNTHELLDKIGHHENGEKTAKQIKEINEYIIKNLNERNNTAIEYIRPDLEDMEGSNIAERSKKIIHKNIIKKLYNDTITYKDSFRREDHETGLLQITPEGRRYFSENILGAFYRYNESNNFLSKNWRENLFPNNIYINLREKLQQKKLLTLEEICDFINYLLYKKPKIENETIQETQQRHHHNIAKSHLINILYSMMYSEQKYEYANIANINEEFSGRFYDMIDAKVSKELNIPREDIYTELGLKGLSSISFKELRGEDVKDLLRGRTWIEDDFLRNAEEKYKTLEHIFSSSIENIKSYYEHAGYTIQIESFQIINKFKKGEIVFYKEEISVIEQKIKQKHDIVEHDNAGEKSNSHVRDFYEYNISNIKNDVVSQKEKDIIQKALNDDNSKTGGNGSYADIKFRMTFNLTKKDKPDHIIKNQSYEHMIVNMNSSNEGGLSDHNIFLDPIKNIPLKLRISTALDTNIFMDSVSGGIDKTIKELGTLKGYIDDPRYKPMHMSMKFITKQFLQRNTIPIEILNIAKLKAPTTYIDLDTDPVAKKKVENAVAEYLLTDQFEKGRLHWFVYDNDNIEGLTKNLHAYLGGQKEISYEHKGHKKMIKKALKENNNGEFCIAGGGSNNLAKGCNSKLFSDKGYLGIVNPVKDIITFFSVPVFAGIVAEGTYIKDESIILGDVKSMYKKTLSDR